MLQGIMESITILIRPKKKMQLRFRTRYNPGRFDRYNPNRTRMIWNRSKRFLHKKTKSDKFITFNLTLKLIC